MNTATTLTEIVRKAPQKLPKPQYQRDLDYGHALLVELFSSLDYKMPNGEQIPNAHLYQRGSKPDYTLFTKYVQQK
jgi:hypothetical protein